MQQVHFLNTTVKLQHSTILCQKPTDQYTYLHSSRFHLEHITKFIVYTQALRYNYFCSEPQDRDSKVKDLQKSRIYKTHPSEYSTHHI